MKKIILSALIAIAAFTNANAQSYGWSTPISYVEQSISHNASISFNNKSDYTMTLKIIHSYGGLYTTIVLRPHSQQIVAFGKTSSYKLKIKAVHYGQTSYHDGGTFSVTCNSSEWTEGEMSFQLSSYGSGLGPSISAKEFESNY